MASKQAITRANSQGAVVRALRFSNAAVKKRMTGTGDGSNARQPFDETRQ
jgi:hypothetical protein